jgi:hypothetical protein
MISSLRLGVESRAMAQRAVFYFDDTFDGVSVASARGVGGIVTQKSWSLLRCPLTCPFHCRLNLVLFDFFAALIVSVVDPLGVPTDIIPVELLSGSSELVSSGPFKLGFEIHDGLFDADLVFVWFLAVACEEQGYVW